MVIFEQAGDSAIGAEVVVHEHLDVVVDGAFPADATQVSVATHPANHLLLFPVSGNLSFVFNHII